MLKAGKLANGLDNLYTIQFLIISKYLHTLKKPNSFDRSLEESEDTKSRFEIIRPLHTMYLPIHKPRTVSLSSRRILVWPNFRRTISHILQGLPLG